MAIDDTVFVEIMEHLIYDEKEHLESVKNTFIGLRGLDDLGHQDVALELLALHNALMYKKKMEMLYTLTQHFVVAEENTSALRLIGENRRAMNAGSCLYDTISNRIKGKYPGLTEMIEQTFDKF